MARRRAACALVSLAPMIPGVPPGTGAGVRGVPHAPQNRSSAKTGAPHRRQASAVGIRENEGGLAYRAAGGGRTANIGSGLRLRKGPWLLAGRFLGPGICRTGPAIVPRDLV